MNLPETPDDNQSGSETDLPRALAQLRRESKRYLARILGSLVCWVIALTLLVGMCGSLKEGGPHPFALFCCLLFAVIGAITLVPDTRSRALPILTAQQDTRAIGPLLDALEGSPAAKVEQIKALLTVLLPRLTYADRWLLSRAQRLKLVNELLLGNADQDLAYLLAILQALEAVGEDEALLRVRQFVERGAITAGQRQALEAATVCLRRLEAGQERQQARASLLRASAPSSTTGTELLRPTQATMETQPETLLRPTE